MKKEKRTGRWETKAPPAGPGARLRILAYQNKKISNQSLQRTGQKRLPLTLALGVYITKGLWYILTMSYFSVKFENE